MSQRWWQQQELSLYSKQTSLFPSLQCSITALTAYRTTGITTGLVLITRTPQLSRIFSSTWWNFDNTPLFLNSCLLKWSNIVFTHVQAIQIVLAAQSMCATKTTQGGHEDMSYFPPYSLYLIFGMNYNLAQSATDCIACEGDNLVGGNKRQKTSIFDRNLDDFQQPTRGIQ